MKVDLKAIRKRCENTTPPPWEFVEWKNEKGVPCYGVNAPCPCCGRVCDTVPIAGKDDAYFIANARQDIPDLLAYIDEQVHKIFCLETDKEYFKQKIKKLE